jgi:hypothetical protein
MFSQGGGLVPGTQPSQRLGHSRVGASNRSTTTSRGPGPSLRSWRAIRQRGICRGSRKAWDDSEHGPPGKSVRQCKLRKLPENVETGGNLCEPVQRLRTLAQQCRRIHRKILCRPLLQTSSPARQWTTQTQSNGTCVIQICLTSGVHPRGAKLRVMSQTASQFLS